MGQRVQSFLIVPNVFKKVEMWLHNDNEESIQNTREALKHQNYPVKLILNLEKRKRKKHENDESEYNALKLQFAALSRAFGDEDYMIIMHYHHCLYAASAVSTVYNVLNYCRKTTRVYNDFHPKRWALHFVDLRTLSWVIEFSTALLSMQTNFEFAQKIAAEKGYLRSEFLNLSCPELRDHFDIYQNDGGIFIIDTIRKKYAFLQSNICGKLKPISAIEYYRDEYPTQRELLRNFHTEKKTEEEILKMLATHKKRIRYIKKEFEPFKLLTNNEIAYFFPKMSHRLLGENEAALMDKLNIELQFNENFFLRKKKK